MSTLGCGACMASSPSGTSTCDSPMSCNAILGGRSGLCKSLGTHVVGFLHSIVDGFTWLFLDGFRSWKPTSTSKCVFFLDPTVNIRIGYPNVWICATWKSLLIRPGAKSICCFSIAVLCHLSHLAPCLPLNERENSKPTTVAFHLIPAICWWTAVVPGRWTHHKTLWNLLALFWASKMETTELWKPMSLFAPCDASPFDFGFIDVSNCQILAGEHFKAANCLDAQAQLTNST